MEIKGVQKLYQTRAGIGALRQIKKLEENIAAGKENSAVDTVSISADASFKARLDNEIKAYAPAMKGNVGADRIERLKLQYQGDTCLISGLDVASAIMRQAFGADAGTGDHLRTAQGVESVSRLPLE